MRPIKETCKTDTKETNKRNQYKIYIKPLKRDL